MKSYPQEVSNTIEARIYQIELQHHLQDIGKGGRDLTRHFQQLRVGSLGQEGASMEL